MVSKASEDFPDPLSPVITVKVLRGISTSMFFRLCCRAPCTVMRSSKTLFSHIPQITPVNHSSRRDRSRFGSPSWRLDGVAADKRKGILRYDLRSRTGVSFDHLVFVEARR